MTRLILRPETWDGEDAVILAHGAGQGMNSPFMGFFREEIAHGGTLSATFNFDYMDSGRKLPDPQPRLRDCYRQRIAELMAEFAPKRLFVGGKSMGGRVASYIAGDIPFVSGLIFLGYPLHPPGSPDKLRDMHLYTLQKPMLFISGTKDTLARKELLQEVVERIGARATLVWIEGGDHSLKRGKTSAWDIAAEAISGWMRDTKRGS